MSIIRCDNVQVIFMSFLSASPLPFFHSSIDMVREIRFGGETEKVVVH